MSNLPAFLIPKPTHDYATPVQKSLSKLRAQRIATNPAGSPLKGYREEDSPQRGGIKYVGSGADLTFGPANIRRNNPSVGRSLVNFVKDYVESQFDQAGREIKSQAYNKQGNLATRVSSSVGAVTKPVLKTAADVYTLGTTGYTTSQIAAGKPFKGEDLAWNAASLFPLGPFKYTKFLHGTKANFKQFKKDFRADGAYGYGTYLTSSQPYADRFASYVGDNKLNSISLVQRSNWIEEQMDKRMAWGNPDLVDQIYQEAATKFNPDFAANIRMHKLDSRGSYLNASEPLTPYERSKLIKASGVPEKFLPDPKEPGIRWIEEFSNFRDLDPNIIRSTLGYDGMIAPQSYGETGTGKRQLAAFLWNNRVIKPFHSRDLPTSVNEGDFYPGPLGSMQAMDKDEIHAVLSDAFGEYGAGPDLGLNGLFSDMIGAFDPQTGALEPVTNLKGITNSQYKNYLNWALQTGRGDNPKDLMQYMALAWGGQQKRLSDYLIKQAVGNSTSLANYMGAPYQHALNSLPPQALSYLRYMQQNELPFKTNSVFPNNKFQPLRPKEARELQEFIRQIKQGLAWQRRGISPR